MAILNLFFGFRGRINRARYWAATVIVLLFLLGPAGAIAGSGALADPFILYAALLLFLVWGCSTLAIGAKRFHDRGQSGWWILFPLAPQVIVLSGELLHNAMFVTAGHIFSAATSIWFLVELGFLRGMTGANEYGPDPLASAGLEERHLTGD